MEKKKAGKREEGGLLHFFYRGIEVNLNEEGKMSNQMIFHFWLLDVYPDNFGPI